MIQLMKAVVLCTLSVAFFLFSLPTYGISRAIAWGNRVSLNGILSFGLNQHEAQLNVMSPLRSQYRSSLWYGNMQVKSLFAEPGSLISIGVGYKQYFPVKLLGGLHCYIDVGKRLGTSYYIKLSPGFTIYYGKTSFTFNSYFPLQSFGPFQEENFSLKDRVSVYYKGHQRFQVNTRDPYHLEIDGKISHTFFSNVNIFGGIYHIQQTPQTDNVWGVSYGFNYWLNSFLKLECKQSFDTFNQRYTRVGIHFEKNPYTLQGITPQLFWHKTDRHMAPLSLSHNQVIGKNFHFFSVNEPSKANATFEKPAPLYSAAGHLPPNAMCYLAPGTHHLEPPDQSAIGGAIILNENNTIEGRTHMFDPIVEKNSSFPEINGIFILNNMTTLRHLNIFPLKIYPNAYSIVRANTSLLDTSSKPKPKMQAAILTEPKQSGQQAITNMHLEKLGIYHNGAANYAHGVFLKNVSQSTIDALRVVGAACGIALEKCQNIKMKAIEMRQVERGMTFVETEKIKLSDADIDTQLSILDLNHSEMEIELPQRLSLHSPADKNNVTGLSIFNSTFSLIGKKEASQTLKIQGGSNTKVIKGFEVSGENSKFEIANSKITLVAHPKSKGSVMQFFDINPKVEHVSITDTVFEVIGPRNMCSPLLTAESVLPVAPEEKKWIFRNNTLILKVNDQNDPISNTNDQNDPRSNTNDQPVPHMKQKPLKLIPVGASRKGRFKSPRTPKTNYMKKGSPLMGRTSLTNSPKPMIDNYDMLKALQAIQHLEIEKLQLEIQKLGSKNFPLLNENGEQNWRKVLAVITQIRQRLGPKYSKAQKLLGEWEKKVIPGQLFHTGTPQDDVPKNSSVWPPNLENVSSSFGLNIDTNAYSPTRRRTIANPVSPQILYATSPLLNRVLSPQELPGMNSPSKEANTVQSPTADQIIAFMQKINSGEFTSSDDMTPEQKVWLTKVFHKRQSYKSADSTAATTSANRVRKSVKETNNRSNLSIPLYLDTEDSSSTRVIPSPLQPGVKTLKNTMPHQKKISRLPPYPINN